MKMSACPRWRASAASGAEKRKKQTAGNGVTGKKNDDGILPGSRRYLEKTGYALPCDDAATGSTTWVFSSFLYDAKTKHC